MSESAPTPAPVPEAALSPVAQAKIESIQAEAAQVKLDADAKASRELAKVMGDENFGKYDAEPTVRVPGELTHAEYHAQRPSEGIYRDGNVLRSASNSQFASTEDYIKQTGRDNKALSADKHYDEVNGFNTPEAITVQEEAITGPERPDYSKMDIDKLVFATATALELGDKAEVADIRAAYETPFLEEVTRPGSTMDESEYDAAMARFDKLVSIAVEYEKAKNPERAEKVDAIVAKNERGPNVGDKIKAFWNKTAEGAKKTLFKPEWWATRWTMTGHWISNIGITPDMDPAAVEKRKKITRVVFILGASAVALGALGLIDAATHGSEVVSALPPDAGNGGEPGPATSIVEQLAGQGAGTGTESTGATSVLERLAEQNAALGITVPEAPEPPSIFDQFRQPVGTGTVLENPVMDVPVVVPEAVIAPEAFNVPEGGGGYELFGNLGLSSSTWDANAENLLAQFPSDFMRLPDNSIGIAHSGLLSTGAQDAINALRP